MKNAGLKLGGVHHAPLRHHGRGKFPLSKGGGAKRQPSRSAWGLSFGIWNQRGVRQKMWHTCVRIFRVASQDPARAGESRGA
jgi:hypothetical protein